MAHGQKITRIDVFTNPDALLKFYEWAAKQVPAPKTKADMIKLLAQYKKADIYVEEHPERVEYMIFQGMKAGRIKPPKGDKK